MIRTPPHYCHASQFFCDSVYFRDLLIMIKNDLEQLTEFIHYNSEGYIGNIIDRRIED